MPEKYVVEMYMDRLSACENYMKENFSKESALLYYNKGRDHYLLHPETKELLERLLTMTAEKGEEETFRYIRKEILHNTK